MATHSQGKYTQFRSGRYAYTKRQIGAFRARGTLNEHMPANIAGKPKKVR